MYPSHRCPISDVYVDTELPSVHTKTASGQDNGCMEDLGCMKGDPIPIILYIANIFNAYGHHISE